MSSLNEILDRKESRVRLKDQLLREYQWPLVLFTLNIPGPEKSGPRYTLAHKAGEKELLDRFKAEHMKILRRCIVCGACGREAFLVVRTDGLELKRICTAIEERHSLGRLFDMDVYDRTGRAIHRTDVGKESRSCFLCDEPAAYCSRSGRHSQEEIAEYIRVRISGYLRENGWDKLQKK